MRGLIALGHLVRSGGLALWWSLTRAGRPLVFTHAADLDADDYDPQMGDVLDALAADGEAFTEVTFVSLGHWSRHRRRTGRASISYAAIHAAARLATCRWRPTAARRDAARIRVAAWLLRRLRPSRVILIDESGSGQPLVRAARRLGIPTIGVQHGDFQPTNHDYAPRSATAFDVVPVDLLCVWSEWFRDRLLAVSPIYDTTNTRVTGRPRRTGPPAPGARAAGPLRVLVIEEANAAFGSITAPFVEILRDEGLDIARQAHPAKRTLDNDDDDVPIRDTGLAASLAWCDVALGIGSSALLEAIHVGRPIVLVGDDDPARYADAGLGARVADPNEILAACHDATRHAETAVPRLRALVWGNDETNRDAAVSIANHLHTDLACSAPERSDRIRV